MTSQHQHNRASLRSVEEHLIQGAMTEPLFDETPYAEIDSVSTGWPRVTPPFSNSASVFVSHTSHDISTCRKWILPAIERAVSSPCFLNYYSFRDERFRDAYARHIIANLRCAEHLVVVLSEAAILSPWVKEEVAWWIRRRGTDDITVVALDSVQNTALHPCLSVAVQIQFSGVKLLAAWALTRRLRKKLSSSDWLVLRRWPQRVHRGMLRQSAKGQKGA